MTHYKGGISPGGDRRSITAAFVYGRDIRMVVAMSKIDCWAKARRMWGEPDRCELFSTPQTIYNDLTGITASRNARKGQHVGMYESRNGAA